MFKHDFEERYSGFGYTLLICKKCKKEIIRIMGRYPAWQDVGCKE